MSILSEVDRLRRIPLFAQIDTSKLKLLAFTSERLAFEKGAVLFKQGDRGDSAYLILEGSVDVVVDSANGPVTVAHLGQNAFVGEMSLLCDMPRTAAIVATAPLDTLKIKKEQFFQLLRDMPQMALEILRELAERLNNTNKELSSAYAKLRSAGIE
ncbi:MAG: cyclic nucleotide-binding domain-containing protein [Alphaproteobacteria bacterium]|nr:cyclic nucleotide-binding domain-containing protein [Alphaproteobacteria bacterium]